MRYGTLQQLQCGDEWWLDDHRSMTVHASTGEPIDTGLLDQHGARLYAVPASVPFGFHPKLRARVKAGRS